jgi:hypothetical protein
MDIRTNSNYYEAARRVMVAYWSLNSRYEWEAQMLGVTFVDPNSWMDDWDFSRDGLHINRRAARHIGQLYSRVCGTGSGRE